MSERELSTQARTYRIAGMLALLLGLFGAAVGLGRELMEVAGVGALLAVLGLYLMKRKV